MGAVRLRCGWLVVVVVRPVRGRPVGVVSRVGSGRAPPRGVGSPTLVVLVYRGSRVLSKSVLVVGVSRCWPATLVSGNRPATAVGLSC